MKKIIERMEAMHGKPVEEPKTAFRRFLDLTPEERQAIENERNKMLAEKHLTNLEKAGVGKRFLKRNFENLIVDDENRKAVETARRFIKRFMEKKGDIDTGILFAGSVGSGKTHIACAIANSLIKAGYSTSYVNITDIISRVQSTYKSNDVTEKEIIDEILKHDLIIIDDLGKETPTKNTVNILYNLIKRIYEDMKPIIVTTNFGGQALKQRYGDSGEAIASRLKEMTSQVVLTGNDRREMNKNEV